MCCRSVTSFKSYQCVTVHSADHAVRAVQCRPELELGVMEAGVMFSRRCRFIHGMLVCGRRWTAISAVSIALIACAAAGISAAVYLKTIQTARSDAATDFTVRFAGDLASFNDFTSNRLRSMHTTADAVAVLPEFPTPAQFSKVQWFVRRCKHAGYAARAQSRLMK